jgi:hypothetical protein
MNNNICPKMKGQKCAGNYCDLWDDEEQRCLEAIEISLRVEILRRKVCQLESQEEEEKTQEEINDFKVKRNVVEGSKAVN